MFLAAAMTASVWAQDTLLTNSPKETYFYNHFASSDTVLSLHSLFIGGDFDEEAMAYHAQDSLQVYGIAIGLTFIDIAQRYPGNWVENSIDSTYCRVRLYEPDGNTMRVLGEGRVYMRDPISYYMALTRRDGSNPDSLVEPFPVYEVFFDNPVTVTDTFYVGFKYSCSSSWVPPVVTYSARYVFLSEGFCELGRHKNPITLAHHIANENPVPWKIITDDSGIYNYYFLYAIAAPPDTTNPGDTINPGGDTLAIDRNDPVYRYTNVAPNPATETVRVTSSFGLSRIEAYDLKGHLISEFRTPNSEFSTTLDVSSWPRGTYLLRITTPAGPTTKKLLIQ